MKEKVYYLGFSPMNGICNEKFFSGSLTVYPTNEFGNIYFSTKVVDTESKKFTRDYGRFVFENIRMLQYQNEHVRFMFFNDKPNIQKLCAGIKNVDFVWGNRSSLISFLNNKFKVREWLKGCVPILENKWVDISRFTFKQINDLVKSDQIVIQEETGTGGETTFYIDSKEDYEQLERSGKRYCVSAYYRNIPINITMVIGKDNMRLLPISAQLISIQENKFRYVGGDFIYPQTFSETVKRKIVDYSKQIGEKTSQKGFRGILGIDYIVDSRGDVFFMEINPRFQSSSFLISKCMEEKYGTNLAALNYQARQGETIGLTYVEQKDLGVSFVNSNANINIPEKCYETVYNGYCKTNHESYYRQIYNCSIVNNGLFEHL